MVSRSLEKPSPAAAPPVSGSELLLRKVPLYAQARQYAAVNAEDREGEGNTLSYGPSNYPLMAAVRACYEMVHRSDAMGDATSSGEIGDPLINRSPFNGIDRADYAHVPAQRKWASTNLRSEGDPVRVSEQSPALVRRAAVAAVLDDALGPAALAQVLEPWCGVIADSLANVMVQRDDEEVRRAKEENVTEGDTKARTKQDGSDRGGAGSAASDAVRVISVDALRLHRRKRVHEKEKETRGVVYTRMESAIMHYGAATMEEKDTLRSARAEGCGSVSDVVMTHDKTSGLSPPETWGSRMLALVTSAVAEEGSHAAQAHRSDEEIEQQQKVLAYLKRVRWITSQWNAAANPQSLKDTVASATLSWSQLTDAQRVQAEMVHTQGQRRRFRRTRRDADEGKDADAAD